MEMFQKYRCTCSGDDLLEWRKNMFTSQLFPFLIFVSVVSETETSDYYAVKMC